MMILGIRMGKGAFSHMSEKAFRCIHFSAALTSFQKQLTYDLFFYGNSPDTVMINHLYNIGRTKVGTGSAPDATTRLRNHHFSIFSLHHFQGFGFYDFTADPDTKAAPYTTVWRRGCNNIKLFCKTPDPGRVRCHLQKLVKRFCTISFH